MNRNVRLLSALTLGLSALFVAPKANAEDFSLHLEPGIAIPVSPPQDNLYGAGPALGVKGMFALKPWLTLGPSVSAMYFPKQADDGSNAGVLWQFGPSLRLQRRRDDKVEGVGLSPWVDVDLMAGVTGDLWRPTFDVGVGAETALDSHNSAWFGPFLRFTHMFQTSSTDGAALLDKRDPNIFQAGVSFSFDFPQKTHTRVVEHVKTQTALLLVPVVSDQPCPVPATKPVEFTEHVYFDWDSANLRWESRDKLDGVIAKLKEHQGVAISVQGHASSDGQKSHNEKLAAARAAAVQKYLTDHGVDGARLTVQNFGIDRPAATNKTQEGRERNRRVDFEVTFTLDDRK
jgi:outer membrane protein OmpA-like peptidoglycan-associated protein